MKNSNEQKFKNYYKEVDTHYSPTNGSEDHLIKFKSMTNDLLGKDYIVRRYYTNGNSIIKFVAYNKKDDTISFFKMSESPNSRKIRTTISTYKYNPEFIDGTGSNALPINTLSTNWMDREFPSGKYVAEVGFGRNKMSDSEIQEFYNNLLLLNHKPEQKYYEAGGFVKCPHCGSSEKQ